jgi:hypothetical protein
MNWKNVFRDSVMESYKKSIDNFTNLSLFNDKIKKMNKKDFVQEFSNLNISYEDCKKYLKFSYGLLGLSHFKPLMLKIGIIKAKEEGLNGLDAKLKIDEYVLG